VRSFTLKLLVGDPADPVIITGCKSTRARKTTLAQRHAN
jgi:hypothetical protein